MSTRVSTEVSIGVSTRVSTSICSYVYKCLQECLQECPHECPHVHMNTELLLGSSPNTDILGEDPLQIQNYWERILSKYRTIGRGQPLQIQNYQVQNYWERILSRYRIIGRGSSPNTGLLGEDPLRIQNYWERIASPNKLLLYKILNGQMTENCIYSEDLIGI